MLGILILTGLGGGCSSTKGWRMDYGRPAAQFHAHDLAKQGKPFIGRKVTVKGTVSRVQDREDGNHVYLEHNVHCVFPVWHLGEDDLKPGDEICVDGFLKRCSEESVELDPAMKRESTASFKPFESSESRVSSLRGGAVIGNR